MRKQALFVWGGWDGHEPRQTAEMMAEAVEGAGMCAELRDALDVFADSAALREFAVVVPCWTMGTLTPEQETGLTEAVRAGVGLAGWHGGMGDAFRASTTYQFMTGGQFVAHPGNFIDYRVRITDRSHPITAGIDDFDVRSEQYYMHVDPSNRVLAETEFSGEHAPWIAGCRMPVVWTRRWGDGRVFYCSIGHNAADLRIPAVHEIVRRGILWAASALQDGPADDEKAPTAEGSAR